MWFGICYGMGRIFYDALFAASNSTYASHFILTAQQAGLHVLAYFIYANYSIPVLRNTFFNYCLST